MTRLNLLLLLMLIGSALWAVTVAYESRRLVNEIHRSEIEADRLEGERVRLEAERQAQATTVRVERTAREKLAMRTVTPAVTMYEGAASVPLLMASAPKPAQRRGNAPAQGGQR